MILFTLLLIIAVLVLLAAIGTIGAIGAAGVILFAEPIICIALIVFAVKALRKRKKK